jgi:molybdenum-dependent DNA-binding transcriptional regulator ModE
MASDNSDIAVDNAILAALNDMNRQLQLLAQQRGGGEAQVKAELNRNIKELVARISTLTSLLGQSKDYRIEVTVAGADGAVHDLVSRVIDDVLVRVKQENLLRVTNG